MHPYWLDATLLHNIRHAPLINHRHRCYQQLLPPRDQDVQAMRARAKRPLPSPSPQSQGGNHGRPPDGRRARSLRAAAARASFATQFCAAASHLKPPLILSRSLLAPRGFPYNPAGFVGVAAHRAPFAAPALPLPPSKYSVCGTFNHVGLLASSPPARRQALALAQKGPCRHAI